jgi:hypothetical protein
MAAKPLRSKRKSSRHSHRLPLEPTRNYQRPEAALACGVAVITIIRAFESGHLKAYRIGRRVIHSGQHLLDWLNNGGKTGCVKTSGLAAM